jgi:hypothetical protein
MSADEVRFAEAVASLTARLSTWGVEESASRAEQFVRDMLHQGWRPRAPRGSGFDAPTPDQPGGDYQAARDALRKQPRCSHGVKPEHCTEKHETTPEETP